MPPRPREFINYKAWTHLATVIFYCTSTTCVVPRPPLSCCKRQWLGTKAWERGYYSTCPQDIMYGVLNFNFKMDTVHI